MYNIPNPILPVGVWNMKIRILCLFLLLLLLAGCAPEKEAVAPEFVLTYAENQPDNYPTTLGAKKFAALVAERTGGKVIIQVKSGGEFGTEAEVLSQMYFGGIDFARVSLSSVSDSLPVLNVLQLPFLYEDSDHMWRILDGHIGDAFLDVFAQQNLVGLSWYDAGARCFYSTTPIESPDDLAGLTVRVQDSQMMMDMVTLLGGNPVTFAYSDVYAAFETGQIDVAENNWPSYQIQKHYEQAAYFTVDQHTRVPEIQLASARTWEQLPEEYREIILACARESALYEREVWTSQEEQSRNYARARGCTEILLTQAAQDEFRERVQPLYESCCGEYLDLIEQIQNG